MKIRKQYLNFHTKVVLELIRWNDRRQKSPGEIVRQVGDPQVWSLRSYSWWATKDKMASFPEAEVIDCN